MSITRRSLIRRLLLVIGTEAGLSARRRRAAAAPTPADAAALSTADLDDLLAFGEVVVAGTPLSPVERRFLADHVAYRMARGPAPYSALCRTTVGLLGRLAGTRFARLDFARRHALVTRYRLGSSSILPDEDLGPSPDDARVVRTRMVADLIGGFYGSPAGWAVVGYDAFPGACSDLTRYTAPPPGTR